MDVKIESGSVVYINGKAIDNPATKYPVMIAAILFACCVVALVALIVLPLVGVVLTNTAVIIAVVATVVLVLAVWFIAPVAIFAGIGWFLKLFKRR